MQKGADKDYSSDAYPIIGGHEVHDDKHNQNEVLLGQSAEDQIRRLIRILEHHHKPLSHEDREES